MESRIVSAVGVSVHSEVPGLADAMQAAGAAAVQAAMDDGLCIVNDADKVKQRVQDAMAKVRDAYAS